MNTRKLVALLFLLLVPVAGLLPQAYEYTCYCSTAGSTPDNIVHLDNNEELLLALQRPQTLAQLQESGLRFSHSQIQLLLDWKLLEQKGDVFRTAFPILDAAATAALRQRVARHAREVSDQLAGRIAALRDILVRRGRGKAVYTVLFSYVLDNLVWKQFEAEKILKPNRNSLERPFWSGSFWAVSPKRNAVCGTNSISDRGYSLKISWAPRAIPLMKPFVQDWKNQLKMFSEIIAAGKVTDPDARAVFEPFRIFDADGRPTFPRITEDPGDPLFRCCLDLARSVSAAVLAEMETDGCQKLAGCEDRATTLVIAYHEWMWELLDVCEAKGMVAKPLAFAQPEKATAADIGDLIFLVKSEP